MRQNGWAVRPVDDFEKLKTKKERKRKSCNFTIIEEEKLLDGFSMNFILSRGLTDVISRAKNDLPRRLQVACTCKTPSLIWSIHRLYHTTMPCATILAYNDRSGAQRQKKEIPLSKSHMVQLDQTRSDQTAWPWSHGEDWSATRIVTVVDKFATSYAAILFTYAATAIEAASQCKECKVRQMSWVNHSSHRPLKQ